MKVHWEVKVCERVKEKQDTKRNNDNWQELQEKLNQELHPGPKFLDKSSGFYGRLDEPETTGEAEQVRGNEVEERRIEDSNGEERAMSSPAVVNNTGGDERDEAEAFDFNEGLMEDDGETLLRRKPSRRSSRWRRSSRRKQKEGRTEEDSARDERPSLGKESPVDSYDLQGTRVMIEVEMENVKQVEEPALVHFPVREHEDDQVLIREKKRGREEEGGGGEEDEERAGGGDESGEEEHNKELPQGFGPSISSRLGGLHHQPVQCNPHTCDIILTTFTFVKEGLVKDARPHAQDLMEYLGHFMLDDALVFSLEVSVQVGIKLNHLEPCLLLQHVYLLQQQCTELLPAVLQSESVCTVHHPHQAVCALKSFDVEAQGWGDGADVFAVKLLQDGRLPRVVQSSARASRTP
ncbi:hypothetical protein INR49_011715 [Caranx melampygus]|nr:hypothetical protein INR49_011715 [Caranx melampygus]